MSSNSWFATVLALTILSHPAESRASVYQWSVPVPAPAVADRRPAARAYLWIPPKCVRVRAIVFGQHNMLEEDILDDDRFRLKMAALNFAIIWVSPSMDAHWDTPAARDRFIALTETLADASGYSELKVAPVVPIGHSAHASFPWNFAAMDPQRTLAVLSIHGDAPRTPIAGFGPQNVNWPDGTLDGIPGLMAMGEYEWIDARLAPATVFKLKNPKTPLAVLAEPGAGHFAAADTLVPFLNLFLEKIATVRLPPSDGLPDAAPQLTPIDPAKGWLVQRWTLNTPRTAPPGPVSSFTGDAVDAFWAMDHEMADAIQNYRTNQVGKKPQLIGFIQDGQLVPPTPALEGYRLKFQPQADGLTFTVQPQFLSTVTKLEGREGPGKNNLVRWSQLPAGTAIGHSTIGDIAVHRIAGPFLEIAPNTFRLSFERGTPFDKPTLWFAASHPGDSEYRSAVQQGLIVPPRNTAGEKQTIAFDSIAGVSADAKEIRLSAKSSAGLPVHFFVREGPAEVDGDQLRLLPIPPRAKYPARVTVVAWQWGRSIDPKVQTAVPLEQSFDIVDPVAPASSPTAKETP